MNTSVPYDLNIIHSSVLNSPLRIIFLIKLSDFIPYSNNSSMGVKATHIFSLK